LALDFIQGNRFGLLGALVQEGHELDVASRSRNLLVKIIDGGEHELTAIGGANKNVLLAGLRK
jgi:hypothetical protein